MENGKCSKEFPKAYAEETDMCVNGYPLYKRPRIGNTCIKEINVNNKKTSVQVNNLYKIKINI